MIYPKALEEVIEYYKRLPGIGEKSAERLALASIEIDDDNTKRMLDNLEKLKTLKKCEICGHITDSDMCQICADENRDKDIICVIEDYKSVFAFEKAGNYNGTYHVLNGLISPIDDINPEDINISKDDSIKLKLYRNANANTIFFTTLNIILIILSLS